MAVPLFNTSFRLRLSPDPHGALALGNAQSSTKPPGRSRRRAGMVHNSQYKNLGHMTPQQIYEAVKLVQQVTDKIYKYLGIEEYDLKHIHWKLDPESGIFTVKVIAIENSDLIEEKKIFWNEIF
jgi:hypothetical protein